MIILLLVIAIGLLIVSFFISNKDIISPPVILCAVYVLSISSAMYNIAAWRINLSEEAVLYISSGMISFCIISFITHKRFAYYTPTKILDTIILIPKSKLLFALLISIICYILYVREINSFVGSFGSDYSLAMQQFREEFSYGDMKLSFVANQAIKVLSAIAFVYIFIISNNISTNKSWKYKLLYLVPVVLLCHASLKSGVRAMSIQIFTMFLVFIIFFKRKYGHYDNKKVVKYILYIGGGSVLFLIAFSAIRYFVGRQNDSDIMEYLTAYIGGSIQLFDLYLQSPNEVDTLGLETFGAFYNNLVKLGIIDGKEQVMHMEFRYSNGILLGNVYTSFRAFHHDLGYWGIILFSAIEGFFFTYYYEKMKKLRRSQLISAPLILYGVLSMPLFEHAIQEQFFRCYFCMNTIVTYILLLLIIKIMKPVLYE